MWWTEIKTSAGRGRGLWLASDQPLREVLGHLVLRHPVLGHRVPLTRTVTAWSLRVSKSTVMQNGVPISSCRR